MCSLNWRQFESHISIAFNRDESIGRAKAEIPHLFNDGTVNFLMPRDPAGNGSWLAVNQCGFVFLLLNDYQGQLKSTEQELISRGLLIRGLASCRSLPEITKFVANIDLTKSQPFYLVMISMEKQICWHYDGIKTELVADTLPEQIYSSGHADAEQIIQLRKQYVDSLNLENDDDLIKLHQSHQPLPNTSVDNLGDSINSLELVDDELKVEDLKYPICMHREDAKTQSLTHIILMDHIVKMKYWNGQPCLTDHFFYSGLTLS
jgi:hypothetical protein